MRISDERLVELEHTPHEHIEIQDIEDLIADLREARTRMAEANRIAREQIAKWQSRNPSS